MRLLVKDLAKDLGCSESIIYRHLRNHSEELTGKVIKDGRRTWITDEGQEYIRGLMDHQPIVLVDPDYLRDMDLLKEENAKLKDKLIFALEALDATRAKLENGLTERIALETVRVESVQAINERDALRERANQAEADADRQRRRAEEAEQELKRLAEQLTRPISIKERLLGRREHK